MYQSNDYCWSKVYNNVKILINNGISKSALYILLTAQDYISFGEIKYLEKEYKGALIINKGCESQKRWLNVNDLIRVCNLSESSFKNGWKELKDKNVMATLKRGKECLIFIHPYIMSKDVTEKEIQESSIYNELFDLYKDRNEWGI